MNTEDFVTYEQALALKELGFIEECLYLYDADGNLIDKHKTGSDDVGVNDLYYSHNELLFTKGVNTQVCDAPTLSQAQKWLKDEKNKYVSPVFLLQHFWNCNIYDVIEAEPEFCSDISYSSYEEALSAGITECIKILEKENKSY